MMQNSNQGRRDNRAVCAAVMVLMLMPLATSCISEATVHPHTLPLGAWGGTDISLTASNSGATMQFSCGVGKVNPPLSLDGDGNFTWTGTTQRVGGAPSPSGLPEPEVPTTFSGVASLSRIVLRVTPTGQPLNERVFDLMRGSPGVVYACP